MISYNFNGFQIPLSFLQRAEFLSNFCIFSKFPTHFLFFCHLVQTDCGKTTKYMTSYFQNPGWPGASQERLICTLTVEIQPGVEQIQLDFVSFEVSLSERERGIR